MEKLILDDKNKKILHKFLEDFNYESNSILHDNELTEDVARKIFHKIINKSDNIRNNKFDDEIGFKDIIEKIFNKYDKYKSNNNEYKNMKIKDIFEGIQISLEMIELDNLYYECKNAKERANIAIESINGIEKYNLSDEKIKELKNIQIELKELLNKEKLNNKEIEKRIDKYNRYAIEIWKNYITSKDDVNNDEYRWIIHSLTNGNFEGDFKDKYMSTSLITNNIMGTFERKMRYGLIIKPKNIVSASYKDTYTLNSNNEEELFMVKPPIMLPKEIEDICIKQTIRSNGEMLNYSNNMIYPEIVVDEYEIEGIYYISNGEKELARGYERAIELANSRGLPLIERDISKYRSKLGLEPIPEKERIVLLDNILYKICKENKEFYNIYLYYGIDFVDNHYQEFYDKYIKLKQTEDFSKKSILKLLSEVTKNDNHFDKVSLNLQELYLTPEEKNEVLMKEYGIKNIKDKETLKNKLEYIISNGIQYSSINSEYSKKKFAEIKQIFPQFESFKDIYIQLRHNDLEDKLYEDLELNNLSYDDLVEKAKRIIEEKNKTKIELEQKQESEKKEILLRKENIKATVNLFKNNLEIVYQNLKFEEAKWSDLAQALKMDYPITQIEHTNIYYTINQIKTNIEEIKNISNVDELQSIDNNLKEIQKLILDKNIMYEYSKELKDIFNRNFDKKVQDLIKNAKISNLDKIKENLEKEKISIFGKIFGKQKLKQLKLDNIELKKTFIKNEELEKQKYNIEDSLSDLYVFSKCELDDKLTNEMEQLISIVKSSNINQIISDSRIQKQVSRKIENNKGELIPYNNLKVSIKQQINTLQSENYEINSKIKYRKSQEKQELSDYSVVINKSLTKFQIILQKINSYIVLEEKQSVIDNEKSDK